MRHETYYKQTETDTRLKTIQDQADDCQYERWKEKPNL